jgi:hypothetical protein
MSDLKPEDRSWEPGDPEAAIVDLKKGIERLREHVKVFRAVTAPKSEDGKQETP